MILEGRVEVTVGRENMTFESGPFTYFGSQALTTNIGVGESPTGVGGTQLPSTPLQSNPSVGVQQQVQSQQQTPVGSGSGAPHHGSLQSVNLDTMLRNMFAPDYTVRAITDVYYISIRRSMYLAAKRATLMELSQKGDSKPEIDLFENELEKLLHSVEDEERRSMDSSAANRGITETNVPLQEGEAQSSSVEEDQIPVSVSTPAASVPVINSPSTMVLSSAQNPSNSIQTPPRSINLNGSVKIAISSADPITNHQSPVPSATIDGPSPCSNPQIAAKDDPEEILLLQKS
ncbi:hypothetical protein J437_LFUL006612 [Ladona fulva]|uniref:Uncharacterized protein n=1 Tax=Ladona fulva TaxID=123851 RepID=A0A8K0KJE6_LADFU|nr:hypothetical protein J437_LFUL006612 [Ladona fulva]